jgi:hypothetical protein
LKVEAKVFLSPFRRIASPDVSLGREKGRPTGPGHRPSYVIGRGKSREGAGKGRFISSYQPERPYKGLTLRVLLW